MTGPDQLRFRKILDFAELPKESTVECLSFDWSGEPLLLITEGKPAFLPIANRDAIVAWHSTPPKGRHVAHWDGGKFTLVALDGATGTLSNFLQRFDDGWLLADGRGGSASAYSSSGAYAGFTFDFGDAIQDVQTTPSGNIWVSYFDEGIFGKTIAQNGLVCFNRDGRPEFKYHEVSAERGLPPIDDLYAMNVVSESEIWLCYYSDFPIVRLEGFETFTLWPEVAPLRSMAVSKGSIYAAHAYGKGKLFRADLEKGQWRTSELVATDERGQQIPTPFSTCARRNKIGLMTEAALYVAEV